MRGEDYKRTGGAGTGLDPVATSVIAAFVYLLAFPVLLWNNWALEGLIIAVFVWSLVLYLGGVRPPPAVKADPNSSASPRQPFAELLGWSAA